MSVNSINIIIKFSIISRERRLHRSEFLWVEFIGLMNAGNQKLALTQKYWIGLLSPIFTVTLPLSLGLRWLLFFLLRGCLLPSHLLGSSEVALGCKRIHLISLNTFNWRGQIRFIQFLRYSVCYIFVSNLYTAVARIFPTFTSPINW